MNRRVVTWLLALASVAIAGLILVPFFVTQPVRPAGPMGMSGQAAPVFDLLDDTGTPVSLARYRGKIVVMNLWATWCPPCRAEMPDLQRLVEAYGSRGVEVVGVNQGESAAQARLFAQSLRIRFPIWIDDRQQYGRIYAALGLPTTVIVGRDGIVARGFDGPLSFDQMRAAVDPLVASR